MSKSKKLIKQTAWYSLFSNSKTLLQFFSSIVLARLLTPADFGLVAMVSVVIGFSSLFLDLGMTTAYVQKKEVGESHRSSLFLQSAMSGLLLAGFVFVSKNLIAEFYDNAALEPIIVWMAVDLFITALYTTPTAMLRRNSRFKVLGVVSILAFLLSFAVTVFFAISGCGAMSIVYGVVLKDTFMLVATSFAARWCPSLGWDKAVFFDMVKIGGWLSLTRILGFFARQTDTLLVGKFFGAATLGIYNRAYALMLLPLQKIGSVVSETSLPFLKDKQENDLDLYKSLEKILVLELIVTALVVVYVWSERLYIVRLMYGRGWDDVSTYLCFLLPATLFDISRNVMFQSYVIKGKTREQFKISVALSFVVVSFIVAGVYTKDILLLVFFYLIAKVLVWIPTCFCVCRFLSVDIARLLKAHHKVVCFLWPIVLLGIVRSFFPNEYDNNVYEALTFLAFTVSYTFVSFYCLIINKNNKNYAFIYELLINNSITTRLSFLRNMLKST